jgi:hypothetical protein
MRDVLPRPTYPGSVPLWLGTRFAALVAALRWDGLPFRHALPVARALLALWAQETDYGRAEDNFNAGNLHTGSGVPDAGPGWHGARVRRRDGDGFAWFRAYDTLENAAVDAVQFLRSPRYAAAWGWLVRHPLDGAGAWYAGILRPPDGGDGYHPYTVLAVYDYVTILNQLHLAVREREG